MLKFYQTGEKPASISVGYYPNIDFTTIVIEKKGNQLIHKQLVIDDIFIAYRDKPFKEKQWEISAETTEIDGLQTQKATCTFGGREWTAWFSPEIPINNGPYKFGGLPGLILKMASEDGDYTITFAGIENIQPGSYNLKQTKHKLMKKKDFNKIHQSLKDSPIEARKIFSPKEYHIQMGHKTNEEINLEFMIQASNDNAIERD